MSVINDDGSLTEPRGSRKPGSREIMSVWSIDESVVVQIAPVFDDAFVWGMLLADLVGHVSNLIGGKDLVLVQAARERVLMGLAAELNDPTGIPEDIGDKSS